MKIFIVIGLVAVLSLPVTLAEENALKSDPGGGQKKTLPAPDGSSFTITPSFADKEIYDVYERLKNAGESQFITVDLTLHTAHLLFDYSLRAIEIDILSGLAKELSEVIVKESVKLDREAEPTGPSVTAFFAVAAKILDPEFKIPGYVKGAVEKDLMLIKKHEGFEISATLDNAEDFSQYVPRGHYTRNEKFKRYFKAMMWYGRRMFRIEEVRPECLPINDPWSKEHQKDETLMMLKIVWMLNHVKVNNSPAIEVWDRLYKPTVLFAGRTEDLNAAEIKAIAGRIWGKLPEPGELPKIKDEKLKDFIKLAGEKSQPKIDSTGAGRKGFCFMGQRFTPDSYIFQCLVTDADWPFGGLSHPLPYIGKRKPRPFTWGFNPYMNPPERRFMPRGLDVFAVFGSDEALNILKEEGDTEYKGYVNMMRFLRKDVDAMMAERKGENLYYGWLYALIPLLKTPEGKEVPGFMKTGAWLRKELASALASWAELRHDTILYVKQSYTPRLQSMPQPPPPQVGYVSPYPEVYNRIGKMVKKMRLELGALDVMPEGLEDNYQRFEKIMAKLVDLSEKELAGKNLSEADYRWIASVAGQLKSATVLPPGLRERILSETDSRMALIADVHTNNNAKKVLEEGVGTPFILTVNMKLEGKPVTLNGAVFSYYEFKWPMDDRLTDEKWQQMLEKEDGRPALPSWYPFAQNNRGGRIRTADFVLPKHAR